MEHSLVKYEEQTNSFPAYRYYVECTCGFQSRMSTEAAVKSQFDSHLVYHGVEPYFSLLATKEAVTEVEEEKPADWSPFAK